MFKELVPYLRQRAVLLTVTHLEDEKIRVNVVPQKLKDSENTALTTPLTITGTAGGTRPGSAADGGQLCGGASRTQEHPGSSESRDGRGRESRAVGSALQEQNASNKGHAAARTGKSF